MSKRAREFFERWVAENASSNDIEDAAHKVSDLLIAAVTEGIPSSEFDEEFPILDNQLRLAVTKPRDQAEG